MQGRRPGSELDSQQAARQKGPVTTPTLPISIAGLGSPYPSLPLEQRSSPGSPVYLPNLLSLISKKLLTSPPNSVPSCPAQE